MSYYLLTVYLQVVVITPETPHQGPKSQSPENTRDSREFIRSGAFLNVVKLSPIRLNLDLIVSTGLANSNILRLSLPKFISMKSYGSNSLYVVILFLV